MRLKSLVLILVLSACNTSNNGRSGAGGPDDQTNTTDSTPPAGIPPDTINPNSITVPKDPGAADVANNPATQGQVVASSMDSASSAAATGGSAAGSDAANFGLIDGPGLNLTDPPQPSSKTTIASGSLKEDCYAGTEDIQGPGRPNALTWPESSDSSSVFSGSKDDATTNSNMHVEPALLMYPVSASGTPQLTLSVPFAFAELAEVIETDNRTTDTQLQDHAQTSYAATAKNETHRFWVAKNPIGTETSPAITCIGSGVSAKGSSGNADGKAARIKWGDENQVNGLNLLERFARSGTQSQSYLAHHYDKTQKAVLYDSTPTTLSSNIGGTGYRLVQWTEAKTTASAALPDGSTVANAAFVRTKTITHDFTQTNQRVDGSGNIVSDTGNYEEVRAPAPLVIEEYRDTTEVPLLHLITSGTIMKTAKDTQGNVKWFSTLAYSNVKFDLVNSSDVCIPVGGKVTMTTYDKEGGTQLKQVVITYSSTPAASGGGAVDPQIAVAGDDSQSTEAQWIMLNVNHRCDLKQQI